MAHEDARVAVVTGEFLAHAGEQWVERSQKCFTGQAAEGGVVHPLMAHGADATAHLARVGIAAQDGGDVVAMLGGSDERVALGGVVAQPVQELGKAPFGRVDAAAPGERFEVSGAAVGGDFGGFAFSAMVAPEIVVVERDETRAERNDGGAGGVERERLDGLAVYAGAFQGGLSRGGERGHVIGMGLRGVVWVDARAYDGVLGDGRTKPAAHAIK